MKRIDEKLLHLKREIDAGRFTNCPRCGRDTMAPKRTQALSRIADIMICESCGVDEAKLAFMNTKDSLYTWSALQPNRQKSDFKTLSGSEVWNRVCKEQFDVIRELYERYIAGESSSEIRLCAFERCAGLKEMWPDLYRMDYEAADGTLVVRIKCGNGAFDIEGSMISGSDDK